MLVENFARAGVERDKAGAAAKSRLLDEAGGGIAQPRAHPRRARIKRRGRSGAGLRAQRGARAVRSRRRSALASRPADMMR